MDKNSIFSNVLVTVHFSRWKLESRSHDFGLWNELPLCGLVRLPLCVSVCPSAE